MTSVQPLPGRNLEAVLEALAKVIQEAENVRSRQFDDYLQWVANSEVTLSSDYSSSDIASLLRSARFWQLWPQQSETLRPRINFQFALEIEDRLRVLKALHEGLVTQHRRWANGAGEVALPDTNLLLNLALPLDEVDWRVALDARPGVRLVVPLVVIRELDRAKRNHQLKEKARRALSELERLLPDEPDARRTIQTGVGFITSIELLVDDFDHVPMPTVDAEILAQARSLTTLGASRVCVVTGDVTMRRLARAWGVRAVDMPDPE